jgi:hypothetical protein
MLVLGVVLIVAAAALLLADAGIAAGGLKFARGS